MIWASLRQRYQPSVSVTSADLRNMQATADQRGITLNWNTTMRKSVFAPLSVTLLLVLPFTAAHSKTPAECGQIPEDHLRLICYDENFRTQSAIALDEASENQQPALEARLEQEEWEQQQWFSITPHKPNYILPVTYNASADFTPYGPQGELFSDAELKFQLSLKTRLWPNMWRGSSLWAAYTQQSYWQIYADSEASAPFRETNHQPELIWQMPLNFELFGMRARLANFALNHQSNGRERPLSRSWNRITGEIVFERERFQLSAKTWVRVDNPDVDDNPDIEDYMGRIELGAIYRGDKHIFDVWLKNNLSSDNRSGIEANWAFPLAQHLRGYVQLYSGYGENMIDMKNYNNRIGVGIILTDWL